MAKTQRNIPCLVAADAEGNVFDIPELWALGRSGGTWARPKPSQWKGLPQGSLLFRLPDRRPVGWDPQAGRPVVLDEYGGKEVFAACTFLPPAYTHLYLSPWKRMDSAGDLPLYAYCALGFKGDDFVAPAIRVDPDQRQDLIHFDEDEIQIKAEKTLERLAGNRLAEHLVNNCALDYCCPAARNFVLGRWEAPLPTSPACNANCIGCISFQPDRDVPVTQPRLRFVPTVEEVADVAAPHLETAERPVVSFGQGCEGEPLLQAELIEQSILEIRRRTSRGSINLNSNASRPEAVKKLVAAGLNSIRISLNSARPEIYTRYYQPKNYRFEDLAASGKAVSSAGGLVSLNYFIFPGVTDTEEEFDALCSLIREAGVRVIQARNLNIDPDLYLDSLGLPERLGSGFGVDRWMKKLRQLFPHLMFAYFNPPKDSWPQEPVPLAPQPPPC